METVTSAGPTAIRSPLATEVGSKPTGEPFKRTGNAGSIFLSRRPSGVRAMRHTSGRQVGAGQPHVAPVGPADAELVAGHLVAGRPPGADPDVEPDAGSVGRRGARG